MKVMIGVDPHKGSHTATMLDRTERELARIKVRAGCRQLAELLAWADGVGPRTWAVESAGGMGYLLAQQLVAAGETVLEFQRRWRHGCGCSARVSPRRLIQTTPARLPSLRCMLRR